MPQMTYTSPQINDPSQLTDGGPHPAFLMEIAEEATNPTWPSADKNPFSWRWKFAVWENEAAILTAEPEMQSAVSTQKVSPGAGKFDPSKAYLFIKMLLGR